MTYSRTPGHAKTGPLRYTDHYVYNSADCLGKGATASVYLGRNKMTYSRTPGHAKTGPLRYTDHYVYNSADCLGKGATASVYLGRNKDTGDVVAIKVFNAFGGRQIGNSRSRELGLLSSISHKNVMRFITCEKERETCQDVLVMEYCQGGSLHSVLEQPHNGFGLQEREFLRFLTDLSSGLQYLRSKAILHRDIKPGNIMKRVEEDGSTTFVLTDFGASRELDDDETFMSLHGTEEYLHPEMYQCAVLRRPGPHQFTSSVDLWSLGVTLYHVATGRLPFQPYGGRSNTQTMFQITSTRKSGVISGVQLQDNGPITWSRQLPVTCHLSECLRRLIEPILAGLFEADPNKALSFDKYFGLVSDLDNRKTLNVFNTQRSSNLTLYLRPSDSYADIQESIASFTEISAGSQLILLHNRDLATVVEPTCEIRTYPKSILSSQLFLFERDNYDTHRLHLPELPPFPSLSPGAAAAHDVTCAKKCSAVASYIQARTQLVLDSQALLHQASSCLRQFINETLHPLQSCVPKLELIMDITRKRHDSLLVSIETVTSVYKLLQMCGDHTTSECIQKNLGIFTAENGLNEILQKANVRIEEIKLYKSVLAQRMSEQEVTHNSEGTGCQTEDHCLSKVNQLCQDTSSIYTTFIRHKKYGELHDHELFIHKVEKQRLSDLCVKLLSLYQGHCLHGLNLVHQSEQRQISTLLRHLTRVGKVETNVRCVTDCQGQINDKLDKLDGLYKSTAQTMSSQISSLFTNGILHKNTKTSPNVSEECHVTNLAEREHVTGASDIASNAADETTSSREKTKRSPLVDKLLTELETLGTETGDLEKLTKSNTDFLSNLKRILQGSSSLNADSFQREQT